LRIADTDAESGLLDTSVLPQSDMNGMGYHAGVAITYENGIPPFSVCSAFKPVPWRCH
jgi:hypothetical protein